MAYVPVTDTSLPDTQVIVASRFSPEVDTASATAGPAESMVRVPSVETPQRFASVMARRSPSFPMTASPRTGFHVSLRPDTEAARNRRVPRTGNPGDPLDAGAPVSVRPESSRSMLRLSLSRSMSPAERSRSATTVSPPNTAVPVNENGTLSHRRSDDATRTSAPSAERETSRIARGASGFQGMARPVAFNVPRAVDRVGFPRSRTASISPWIRWPGITGIGKTFSTVERESVPANFNFTVPGSRWKDPFASDASSRIASGSTDSVPEDFRREREMSGPPCHARIASAPVSPSFCQESFEPITV
ncbi:MAG: hypothetical protein H6Q84_2651 [Deltaproteobacteria bacterium]|nr:hypothetical protein [Deltaproteobacteria bacterium]